MAQADNTTITSPTRRAVIAGATPLATGAAVNVAEIVARCAAESTGEIPQFVGPIFAAIEAHRKTCANYLTTIGVHDAAEEATSDDAESSEVDAAWDAREQAHNEDWDAQIALINTMPTTIKGLRALISYVEEVNSGAIFSPEDPRWYSSEGSWTDQELDNSQLDPDVPPAKRGCDGPHFAFALLEMIGYALDDLMEREAIRA